MLDKLDFISGAFQLFPIDFFKNIFLTVFDKNALKQLPIQAYSLWLALFLLMVIISLFQNYRNLLKARIIEDTATSKIQSAAQGYIEITGKQYSLPHHAIVSPLSLTPCTWYSYNVCKKNIKNKWFIVSQGESSDHFLVKDSTGFCVIDPIGADITPSSHDSWYGFSATPNGKTKNKIMLLLSFIFGRYQYNEWRMEIGSPIYVLGNFITLHTGESALTQEALEEQAEKLVAQWEQEQNKTGAINAENQDALQQTADKNKNSVINMLSKKGLTARQPYLISNYTQQQLANKFRLKAALWLISFLIFMPCTFWWLSIKL